MGVLAAYRRLLSNKPLTRLLAGEFVSGIGDWLYIVAILIVIYSKSESALVLGLFGAARVAPYVLLSIPAGIVADRFDRRLVLLVSDLARGACMLGIAALVAIDGPVWAIVALAILAACGSTFFYPAIGAYIPSLVTDERELGPANSAYASLDNIGFILGPVLGGVLVAVGGVTLAFVINAATFVVIAAVLWRLPPSIGGQRPADAGEAAGERTTGEAAGERTTGEAAPPAPGVPGTAAATLRNAIRPITGLVVVQFAANVLDGGIAVLTVIVAVEVLRAGEAATGYLNAAIGVGGLIGALLSGVLVLRRRLAPPLIAGVLAVGLGAAGLGASGALIGAMAAIATISAGSLVLEVVTTTILQRVTTDEVRGRATGVMMTAATLAEAAGSLVTPVLVVAFGIGAALAGMAVAVLAAAAVGLVLIGAATSRPQSAFEATLARVAKLPLFAGAPAARLEAALGQLRSVPVAAGDVVIRQGDPADQFYIVRSGEFVVSQRAADGTGRELRRLGPDTVFGELGLLHGASRSASVTAAREGELLALDGPEFLALVGPGGTLRSRLLGLYAGPSDDGVRPAPVASGPGGA